MAACKEYIYHMVSGLIAAAIILLSAWFVAGAVTETRIVRQGRFAAELLAQDSMSLAGIVSNPRKLDATVKFLGAVTAAYINFELIPVNEARTFTVVFEALGDEVSIDDFEYQGRTLIITGAAPNAGASEDFRGKLEGKEHLTLTGYSAYTTVDDTVRFRLECEVQ